jgi:RNA recognition motif-containing protein
MNIYVSNLSFNVQDEDLRSYFAEYGEVSSAKVITDKFTQRSKGFGLLKCLMMQLLKKQLLNSMAQW